MLTDGYLDLGPSSSIPCCLYLYLLDLFRFPLTALTTDMSTHKSSLCLKLLPSCAPLLFLLFHLSSLKVLALAEEHNDLHFFQAEMAGGFYLERKCASGHKFLFSLHDAMCIFQMFLFNLHILSITTHTEEIFLILCDQKQQLLCQVFNMTKCIKVKI